VVNDFSLVHALLGMAMRKTSDAHAARLFRSSRVRIRVIALFHAIAWRGGEEGPSTEEASAYFAEVVREAERARTTHGHVRVELQTNGVTLGLAQIVAAGLCMSELVQNALDHAFPNGRSGHVSVSLTPVDGTDDVVLRVSDDGVGFPPGAEEGSGGLGLALVRLLAEQLVGKLTLSSTENRGADFSLRFASIRESSAWQTS
jgi:two-component system, sensor histidine kinase PdtaS